jgi:hypothetical protein
MMRVLFIKGYNKQTQPGSAPALIVNAVGAYLVRWYVHPAASATAHEREKAKEGKRGQKRQKRQKPTGIGGEREEFKR